MQVGFTGTQKGLTPLQQDALVNVLRRLRERGASVLHHGDCVEADAAAHAVSGPLGYRRVIHPPDNPSRRAFCQGEESFPEAPYLVRNRAIVDGTDLLVACPDGPERVRSGTWSTVRYARSRGKRIILIWPDGTVRSSTPAKG